VIRVTDALRESYADALLRTASSASTAVAAPEPCRAEPSAARRSVPEAARPRGARSWARATRPRYSGFASVPSAAGHDGAATRAERRERRFRRPGLRQASPLGRWWPAASGPSREDRRVARATRCAPVPALPPRRLRVLRAPQTPVHLADLWTGPAHTTTWSAAAARVRPRSCRDAARPRGAEIAPATRGGISAAGRLCARSLARVAAPSGRDAVSPTPTDSRLQAGTSPARGRAVCWAVLAGVLRRRAQQRPLRMPTTSSRRRGRSPPIRALAVLGARSCCSRTQSGSLRAPRSGGPARRTSATTSTCSASIRSRPNDDACRTRRLPAIAGRYDAALTGAAARGAEALGHPRPPHRRRLPRDAPWPRASRRRRDLARSGPEAPISSAMSTVPEVIVARPSAACASPPSRRSHDHAEECRRRPSHHEHTPWPRRRRVADAA
jgi:hypothetical protein